MVGAVFGDAAVVEDQDLVGCDHCGQSVGDDEDGLVDDEGHDGLLDGDFALGVECGGGFVEQDDGGVFEDGAGDGDALAFAA